jgi:threonyl-tRNA synthetase
VVGQREAEAGTVAVRARGTGAKQEVIAVVDFRQRLLDEVARRAH